MKCNISTRYVICVLGSIGLGIIYGLKTNFHVAIVSMVNHTAVAGGSSHDGAAKEDGPFVWSKTVQGFLLSSYFWGYMISELPGGRLAESFSAKWVMFFAIAINVVSALLTPVFAEIHYGLLLVLRVLQGIGGGVTFPGMHVILAHWAPPTERSVMSNIVYAGTALGTVFFMLLAGIIGAKLGWMWIFYIEGGASALWLLLWFFLAADSPATQKKINPEEREFIMKSLNQTEGESSGAHELKMPWKAAMTSPAFLAILVAHTCSNWGWYMVLVELPLYMKTVLKFKLEENSFLTALPFLTMWIFSMIFSKIMDHLRGKNIISTTTARKIATGVASMGPLICFVSLCYLDGQQTGVVLMTLAVTAIGGMFCGFLSNHIDIAPNFAGTLVAVTNTVATIPGIAVPFVVSALTKKDDSINSWRILFWITVALYAIEFIVFSIFGSGEEQAWNKPDSEGESQPLKSTAPTKA
ncbi:sialin isoform X2 [Dendroctonus ponderosae]|uniref:Major facilitator superfamily (MFS) profile domain-containing protein n=1 Tax=Dendroctonus ponderosae TaxID=77166 RepID=A0AAR5PLZ6_DENPD|nr:sialin isoform X2 [Dendroctonus ponderosae]